MLISFNTFFNCFLLVTLHFLKSLDAIVYYPYYDNNRMTFDEKTFYHISDLNETTDWQTADNLCRLIGWNLVSIHNQTQNEFLINLTKHFDRQYWIGLRGDKTTHLWSDRSYFDYNKLNDTNLGKISPIQHKCATFHSVSGQWKYNDCNDTKFGFICHNILKYEPKSKSQESNYKSCQINSFKSGEGIEFGGHCYLFFDEIGLDWKEAQEECAKLEGSNLLSIVNSSEMQFIRNYTNLKFNSSDFWIGLYAKTNSSEVLFQWSDGSAVNITFWKPKEPSIEWKHSSDNCVYQTKNNSEWTVDLCSHKRHYICKSKSENKPSNTKNLTKYGCPSFTGSANPNFNWINIESKSEFCFWFSADLDTNLLKTTWIEASSKCRSHNSSLVSIHSLQSLMKLKNKISANTWIGLTQTEKGYFKWDDNTGLDFTYWESQQSFNTSGNSCVSVQPNNGLKWTLNQCFNKSNIYDFICQKRKTLIPNKSHSKTSMSSIMSSESTVVPNVSTTNISSNSSHMIDTSREKTDSGLPTAAKYGFILLGLVIILSISINVYIMGRKVKIASLFKREPKLKNDRSDRRQRDNDILNSSDPNVVFSNIRLK